METALNSPRPTPIFFSETPFSQRKRTPLRVFHAPRSPAKSCPPVSRVFRTPGHHTGPHFVSFKSERKGSFQSPVYNAQSHRSYFEQCFEVIEKLGEGSFGEVFKVRSREDGKLYAVKKSRRGFRGEWDRKLQLTEVEKHEWLPPHPNCVQFHKAWEERQHLYIQTELCLMSLSEYADLHGRIPEYRVWGFLIELVEGLKHLHDHRLCHFDIKPANIFIGQDGVTCKLGDFGLCMSMDNGLQDAMEGDAKYLAPELLRGGFGKEADMFSLGISLLEVGCDLELPSGGPNWHQLREGFLPEDFTQGLSPDLVEILSRMMHPTPGMRPSVDEVLQDRRVVRAAYRYTVHKFYHRMVSFAGLTCSKVYGGVLTLLRMLLLLSTLLFPGGWQKSREPPGLLPSPQVKEEESFSDDEDDIIQEFMDQSSDDGGDPLTKFNCSWLHNSPIKYPTPVYSGPPIPLDFGDTSADNSFDERNSPRTTLNQSFGSHNGSFSSYTPSSKPSLEEMRAKNLSIGPKNLMDIFEAGD